MSTGPQDKKPTRPTPKPASEPANQDRRKKNSPSASREASKRTRASSATSERSSNADPKSHTRKRLIIVLVIGIALLSLLGWESRNYYAHRATLARLQSEMDRRRLLQTTLRREDVAKYLVGTPQKETVNTPDFRYEYFAWSGLLYRFDIGVVFNSSDQAVEVQNYPERVKNVSNGGSLAAEPQLVPPPYVAPRRLKPKPQHVPEATVNAGLDQAEKYFRISPVSPGFHTTLLSIVDGLPEAKISTVKGELAWNTFRFSRRDRRLFAFQFTNPFEGPIELDYVRWVKNFVSADGNPDHPLLVGRNTRSIDWRFESFSAGVVSNARAMEQTEPQLYDATRSFDIEPNVQADGVELPSKNLVRFGSRPLGDSEKYVLWFYTSDENSDLDFECKTVLFASESEKSPARRGANEICEHIGLRTNLPKLSPTPNGVLEALTALDRHCASGLFALSAYGRILRPVSSALPELKMSTPGTAQWQKVDYSQGSCAAVRIRIPNSIGMKGDLYGAILGDQPSSFGWDCRDQPSGDLRTRMFDNASVAESPATNQLLLFSNTEGLLKPGQEVVLWFRKGEDTSPPPSHVLVTLTARPHVALPPKVYNSVDEADPRIHVTKRPWSCGELLGINVPAPVAPEGCHVMGWNEATVRRLLFTPDSRRLISIDGLWRARIWDVQSRQLEGQIELGYGAVDQAVVDPDSRMLLKMDGGRKTVLRWDLDTRKPVVPLIGAPISNERLLVAAFGTQPQQIVVVAGQDGPLLTDSLSLRDMQLRFATQLSDANEWTSNSPTLRGEPSSLVFLPSVNLFAVGMTQLKPVDRNTIRSVTSVQIWPRDFSKLVQELPIGDLPHLHNPDPYIEGTMNKVRLSYHPKSRRLAAISRRGHVKVWDIGTWTELMSQQTEPGSFTRVHRGPRGQTLETITQQNDTLLFTVSLAPDGETVATTVQNSRSVLEWNVSDGQSRPRWQADDVPVTHVAHSPDGEWVATANTDGVVRLWKNAP